VALHSYENPRERRLQTGFKSKQQTFHNGEGRRRQDTTKRQKGGNTEYWVREGRAGGRRGNRSYLSSFGKEEQWEGQFARAGFDVLAKN